MYVLDKLWRGTLSPSEQCVNHGSEYSQLHHKAAQMGSQILSRISDEEKQLFQKITSEFTTKSSFQIYLC